jgi:hypothetical protein
MRKNVLKLCDPFSNRYMRTKQKCVTFRNKLRTIVSIGRTGSQIRNYIYFALNHFHHVFSFSNVCLVDCYEMI